MRYLISLVFACFLALASPTVARAAVIDGGQYYPAANVTANNTDFFSLDAAKYATLMVAVTSVGGGATVSWQGSNDSAFGGTVIALNAVPAGGGTAVTSTTAIGHWVIPVTTRFIRVRTTAYTSGTITASATLVLKDSPVILSSITGGSLSSNASTNVSQINAVTPLMGNGVTGTGSLRVTIASDNTANSNPWLVVGSAAHSAASSGNPVRVGGRVQTAADTTLVAGDATDIFMTTGGAQIVKQFAIPELDWQYAAAASGILNTTTAVTVKTAGAAGIRNYITGIQVMSEALGAATELAVRDGAAGTVIWRIKIGTGGITTGQNYVFQTPLKGTAATLLEVVTLTASVTGAVYVNCQGFQAP